MWLLLLFSCGSSYFFHLAPPSFPLWHLLFSCGSSSYLSQVTSPTILDNVVPSNTQIYILCVLYPLLNFPMWFQHNLRDSSYLLHVTPPSFPLKLLPSLIWLLPFPCDSSHLTYNSSFKARNCIYFPCTIISLVSQISSPNST